MKLVVPIGGVPVTAPVVGSMDKKAGAPSASEYVMVSGVPVAWKV